MRQCAILLFVSIIMFSCEHKGDSNSEILQIKVDSLSAVIKNQTKLSAPIAIFVSSESKLYMLDRFTHSIVDIYEIKVPKDTGISCNRQIHVTENCVDDTTAQSLCGECSPVKNREGNIICSCTPNGQGGYNYSIICDCDDSGDGGGTGGSGGSGILIEDLIWF